MMMNNIPKPEISPAFTIDDIHKIREWNYERQKDMSISERIADNNARLISAEKRRGESFMFVSTSLTPIKPKIGETVLFLGTVLDGNAFAVVFCGTIPACHSHSIVKNIRFT